MAQIKAPRLFIQDFPEITARAFERSPEEADAYKALVGTKVYLSAPWYDEDGKISHFTIHHGDTTLTFFNEELATDVQVQVEL